MGGVSGLHRPRGEGSLGALTVSRAMAMARAMAKAMAMAMAMAMASANGHGHGCSYCGGKSMSQWYKLSISKLSMKLGSNENVVILL